MKTRLTFSSDFEAAILQECESQKNFYNPCVVKVVLTSKDRETCKHCKRCRFQTLHRVIRGGVETSDCLQLLPLVTLTDF